MNARFLGGGVFSDSKTGKRNRRQPIPSLESEREKVALDISSLKKQYSKLKERQKQVQVILTGKQRVKRRLPVAYIDKRIDVNVFLTVN